MTDDATPLDRLARLAGVEPGYHDIFGDFHQTSETATRAILGALGFPAGADDEVAASLAGLEDDPWRDLVPPVTVLRRGRAVLEVPLNVPDAMAAEVLDWHVVTEDGTIVRGRLLPAELKAGTRHEIDGQGFTKRRFALPDGLPDGYHRLVVDGEAQSGAGVVIVAPGACYAPAWQAEGARLWGVAGHLYSWRSANDWGIGDFTTLAEAGKGLAELGARIVGVNPLHALFPGNPWHCSPYSPSNRLFINPLYIDVEAVPEFLDAPGAVAAADDPDTRALIDAARSAGLVDYAAVEAAKAPVFEALFARFDALPDDHPRKKAFRAFCAEEEAALDRFATFFALRDHFGGKAWHDWPEPYRDPQSGAVATFVQGHATRLDFHRYLQFEADRQLGAAHKACLDAGMSTGLYRDLAVGSVPDGAAAWASPDVFCTAARFGAPPDAYNPEGQDWGMPPYNPHALKAKAYAPFAALLRANMRHAGALRIDHAMSLMRLFWILPGQGAKEGAYVRYPLDDLLGVLALESQRAGCLVIGEDLGTVPDGFRERMAEENVLSFRLVYFERWADGLFKRPEAYPELAMASATTHDSFTIAGHWIDRDLDVKRGIPLFAGHEAGMRAEREGERVALVGALKDQGLLPADFPLSGGGAEELDALIVAIHAFIARTPTALAVAAMDDLAAEAEQLNIPGTTSEHANWRRRIHVPIEDLAVSPLARRVAEAIQAERLGGERG